MLGVESRHVTEVALHDLINHRSDSPGVLLCGRHHSRQLCCANSRGGWGGKVGCGCPTIRPGGARLRWLQQGSHLFYSALYWTQRVPSGFRTVPPAGALALVKVVFS